MARDPIKYARKMLRHWQREVDKLENGVNQGVNLNGVNLKESEKEEKEKIPPHPPKEIKAEKDKESYYYRARTREIFKPSFLQRWKISLQFVDYWLEVTDGQEITDPKKSIRNYWATRNKDSVWSEWQKIHPQEVKAKIYSPQDWLLCQERCACFRNGKCSCGITIPPNLQKPRPYPPEECGHFAKL